MEKNSLNMMIEWTDRSQIDNPTADNVSKYWETL